MVRLTLLFITLSFCQFGFSQTDSLTYYADKGEFKKALKYAEKQIEIEQKKNLKPTENYAFLIGWLLNLSILEKESQKSEIYCEKLINNLYLLKKNDLVLINSYHLLALFYFNKKEYQEAKKYVENGIKLSEEKKYENETYYLLLNLMVHTNSRLENKISKETKLILDKQLIITEKLFTKKSVEFIQVINGLANYYFEIKEFQIAKKYIQTGIETSKELNYYDKIYINLLNLLNTISVDFEDLIPKETITKIDEQIILTEKLFSKNSLEYLIAVNVKGSYYNKNEDFTNAEIYYLQALNIAKSIFGTNHDKYLFCLSNLSRVYLSHNNFSQADYYNQIGLDIVLKMYGKSHIEYLNFISDKAYIKSELGNIENSSTLYEECILLVSKFYSKNSDFYSTLINNYANTFLAKKDYVNAEKFFTEDYELCKKKYGINHYETAMCLCRLSNVYFYQKHYQKAIDNNLAALKIIENTIGKENNNYAIVCSVLGTQYALVNDLQKAEKYSLLSYAIKIKKNGKYNISRIVNIKNLVDLYNTLDDVEKEKNILFEYFDLLRFSLSEMKSNFSENELLSYLKKENPNNTYYTFLHGYPNQYPEINVEYFENELLLKNLTLRNQQRIKTSIEKSSDTNLKEKYQQFTDNKRYLIKLDDLPVAERPSNYNQLVTETENLEKEITRLSSAFADAKKSLSIGWKQIQEKLKPNEVVIDLVDYNYYDTKWTDSIFYGAFVIKKDSKFPKFISFFEQKQLTALLRRNRDEKDSIQVQQLNTQYTEKEIGNLFFSPLEEELKNCKTIYLTPSGLAHQINFKALPINEKENLGERFQVHILGATANLITNNPITINQNKNWEFVLYGAIDYNKRSDNTPKEEENNNFNQLASRSGNTEFSYLAGSFQEIQTINDKAKALNYKTIVRAEKNATEESFKQLDGKEEPFVLHLATHGYFFENIKQEKPDNSFLTDQSKSKIYQASEDPMLRSGLVFAGANKYWSKSTFESNNEDGILSAKEISNLDLSNCQLVVLSACETGLGQVNGSEGVFGLQRAFKMAGVKNIIMSLWKVPDAQTAELFDIFYTECFVGKTIHEAFQTAQAKMKVKYSPYYWAGFVLLE